MKFSFSIFFLVLSLAINAQFAIISDKDGFSNVRIDATTQSKVTDSLKNGRLIYCLETKGNWTLIDYTLNNKELSGYIYKDRYKPISKFQVIAPSAKNEKSVQFKKEASR